MLVLKGWLETRWRFASALAMAVVAIALNFQHRNAPPTVLRGLLALLVIVLAIGSTFLAGSGVKSQAPIGFPEGLAGSTQYTISLPVSRLWLLFVRASIGLLETSVVTTITGCLAWGLFPAARLGATPADLVKLLLTSIVFLTGPYFAAVFFWTFLDDPLPGIGGFLVMTVLLLLSHHVPASVDIFRAWGSASPLVTHSLPWSQMAASAALALILFFAAAQVVQRREY